MYKIYQVMSGDTLMSIANMLGTTVDMLESLNGVTSVSPGQFIIVPNNKQSMFTVHKIEKGDNLYELAHKYNTTVDKLIALNGLNKDDYIYPGQEILVPINGVEIFVTKEGDTLKDLMNEFNTDINNIMSQNDKIYLMKDQLIVHKK